MKTIARIALTPGEPGGIGPDLCIQLVQQAQAAQIVAFADPDLLTERARILGLPCDIRIYSPDTAPTANPASTLFVRPVGLKAPSQAGRLNSANARYVLDALRQATHACLRGEFHALVTGPVHKGTINDAGIAFTGHTEFLAEECGVDQVVMMLTGRGLRVALATTHLPLSEVSRAITRPWLERTLRILHADLVERFAIAEPTILVCGLNPHAGEGGHLGREELETIIPVLDKLRGEGLRLVGPLPADTLFVPRYLQDADAVLAMYHDQGLPVLKHAAFGEAINVTLGLPIIRTSVDHGTALDLAGTGRADVGSLKAAVQLALELAQAKRDAQK